MSNSNRKFGVEIEFAHDYRHLDNIRSEIESKFPDWNVKSDSSITPAGTEITSPILSGEDGLKEVEEVMDYLKKNRKIRVNESCGLHIHTDASDLSPVQILAVSHCYANNEKGFFDEIIESHRNNNRYCSTASLNKITDVNVNTVEYVRTMFSSFQNWRTRNSCNKYRKVNINSYNHGTIEFRHHHATLNKTEMLNWISFVTSYVDGIKNKTESLVLTDDDYREEPKTSEDKDYLAVSKLLKFWEIENCNNRSLMYRSVFNETIFYGFTIHLLSRDFIPFLNNAQNIQMVQKLHEMGFHFRFVDEKNAEHIPVDERYKYITLMYGEQTMAQLLDKYGLCARAIARKVLVKIEKKLEKEFKDIDIFENIPTQTLLYYSKQMQKKRTLGQKVKNKVISALNESRQS